MNESYPSGSENRIMLVNICWWMLFEEEGEDEGNFGQIIISLAQIYVQTKCDFNNFD